MTGVGDSAELTVDAGHYRAFQDAFVRTGGEIGYTAGDSGDQHGGKQFGEGFAEGAVGVCPVSEDGDDPERVGEVFPAGQGIRGQTDPDFAHTAGDRAGRFEPPS
ncbi:MULTISPECIES: hypothetical protein [unclassified Amycolatopsis]|uniref:hypothetical protein n=1 Tax=unclassified Amycolatopsis TaxID=2618356 RepID=UPI00142F557B|nr:MULTISPECIES: hypothetical protein [unclassified Amycolatopsis]